MRRALRTTLVILAASALCACAALQNQDPVQVTVADIESLPGEEFELRMLVKLRVQNPNDTSVEYDGIYLKMDVLDRTFATGVSDERGSIPRFGETVVSVPMTVSALRMAMHGLSLLNSNFSDKVSYRVEGKLNGPSIGSTRFETKGEFALPTENVRQTMP
jgi:LEA14-like dessication related protein